MIHYDYSYFDTYENKKSHSDKQEECFNVNEMQKDEMMVAMSSQTRQQNAK